MNSNPKGRPPSPDSARALAERLTIELGFAVTRQQIGWWRRKGYDLDDVNSLRRSILNQERLPEGCDAARLRRDLGRPAPEPEPERDFGRRLRQILEGMPFIIGPKVRSHPEMAIDALCLWSGKVLKELSEHPNCPDGLPLTNEEMADVAEFMEGRDEWVESRKVIKDFLGI